MSYELKPIVIAGWAGIGKTTLAQKYANVRDMEEMPYHWIMSPYDMAHKEEMKGRREAERTLNPDFPDNYIQAIKDEMGKYLVLTIWDHDSMWPHYRDAGIEYILCHPDQRLATIAIYKQRYAARGNREDFVDRVSRGIKTIAPDYAHKASPKATWILHGEETLEDRLLEMGYPLVPNGEEK